MTLMVARPPQSPQTLSRPTSTMLLTPYFLALVPFVAASGVHKLKLQKLPSAASNPELESAYLAEKYGGAPGSLVQLPLMGSGGSGRRVQRPSIKDGEQLFWKQEQIKGGHGVPLTSASIKLPHVDTGLQLTIYP